MSSTCCAAHRREARDTEHSCGPEISTPTFESLQNQFCGGTQHGDSPEFPGGQPISEDSFGANIYDEDYPRGTCHAGLNTAPSVLS